MPKATSLITGALAAATSLLLAAAPAPQALLYHRPIVAVNPNQSNNWSGYNQGALEKGVQFHQVSATWAVLIAEFLVVFSDLMLGMPGWIIGLHALTVLVLALGLSGLSVGLGAWMPNFRESEVWIERFPNGRLLSTAELCRLPGRAMHPRTIRTHVIETLHAASRGVAHLTLPKDCDIKSSKLRVAPLLTTCTLVRHHIREHFYRQTLNTSHPTTMDHFDEMFLKHFQKA